MNLGHVFFVKLINLFFQSNLRDPFSMYKVMRVEIFKNYNFTSDRFDLDWEFVCISLRKGVNIIEIQIIVTDCQINARLSCSHIDVNNFSQRQVQEFSVLVCKGPILI